MYCTFSATVLIIAVTVGFALLLFLIIIIIVIVVRSVVLTTLLHYGIRLFDNVPPAYDVHAARKTVGYGMASTIQAVIQLLSYAVFTGSNN